MKKILSLFIICIFYTVGVFAESIRTSFTETINLTNIVGMSLYIFSSGESVTIHAYKKKEGKYHFLIETDSYAGFISCTKIPFNTSEKELKKLPNALSNDADVLLKESQHAVYLRKARKEQQERLVKEKAEAEAEAQYRMKALSGQVKGILTTFGGVLGLEDDNGLHRLCKEDTVSIIGYSQVGNYHNYAIYSDKVAGIFHTTLPTSSTFTNDRDIDFNKLPSETDPKVALVLKKQSIIVDSINAIKRIEENKRVKESLMEGIQEYKVNSPFIIDEISWSSNSAGGLYVSLDILNCTNQTIKYVTFQGYFLNAVRDKCHNEIGGGTIWKARGIGPIGPCPTTIENHYERIEKCKASYDFDNLSFYSRSADTFRLSSVTVEYTNGRKITLGGSALSKHVRY